MTKVTALCDLSGVGIFACLAAVVTQSGDCHHRLSGSSLIKTQPMTTKLTFEQEHSAPSELRLALQAIGSTVEKSKKSILFRRADKPVGVFLVRKRKVILSLDGTSVASWTLGPGPVLWLPATLNRP